MDRTYMVHGSETGHLGIAHRLDFAITHAAIQSVMYKEDAIVMDDDGIIGVYYPPFLDEDGEFNDSQFHWKRKKSERMEIKRRDNNDS